MGQRKTILFVHYGEEWIRGSERVLLDLMSGLDAEKFRPVLWCNADAMAAEARRAGIQAYLSPMAYFLDYSSPRPSLSSFLRLMSEARRIIRRERVDLVHANSAAPCQWLAPVTRSIGLPMLVHIHSNYFPRSRYICLLHLAHQIIGVSRYTLQGLQHDGLAAGKMQVILNGIDWARMTAGEQRGFREDLGIPSGDFVILSVGSLIYRKGHDRLIMALHQLDPALRAHLVIVGEGEHRAALEAHIARLGLEGRVHLLGARPALAAIYADADCFALASHDEAWGLVFAEAGHCGLPSIGTRRGGIPEVVEDGQTGFLVDGEDENTIAAAVADKLRLLATDPGLRLGIGDAAREKAIQGFESQRMIESFAAIYDRMTAAPQAASGWRGIGLRPYLRMAQRHRPSLGF